LEHPSPFVTITHPFHPWNGQQVKVIHIQRGADPDLLVQRPDGRHVLVAMSWTDYAGSSEKERCISPPPLLELDGLRQVVQFIEGMRREGRYPAPDDLPGVAGSSSESMLNVSNEQKT
jgi:hypothetical protein